MTSSETRPTIRISVDVPPELHRRLKIVAAQQGMTLSEILRGLASNWVEKQEAR